MQTILDWQAGFDGEILESYYASRDRVTLIMGPLGSGKTVCSCQKLMDLICEQEPNDQGIRPSRYYAVRNTYPDLLTTTVKDWMQLFGELGKYTEGSKKPPIHEMEFELADGTTVRSELIFIALDREEHVKKLRGSQATGFWLNETKELPKSVVDMADLRHGRYPSKAAGGVLPTWHGMIGDTNAPDEDHWYFELAEVVKPDGWVFFRQPGGVSKVQGKWVENPDAENLNNLPADYYINGMQGKKQDWIAVNLGNEYGFVQDGRPIFPEYLDGTHCAREELDPIHGLTIYVGIDFGLTPAAVFGQRMATGQWRVLREIVSTRMGAKQLAVQMTQIIKEHYPGYDFSIWGDPSGDNGSQNDERTAFDFLRAGGIQAFPTHTNEPEIRRQAVAEPLSSLIDGQPGFIISPTCKVLRKALAGAYCLKRVKVVGDERFHDKPDKNRFSHVAEALEYMMLGAGEGRAVIKSKVPMAQPVQMKTDWNPLN